MLTIQPPPAPPAGTPGTLQLSAATYTASQSDKTATILVSRTGGSTGSVTVNYATSNGTAVANEDYTAVQDTLTFGPGVTSMPLTVPIISDPSNTGPETVNVTLSSPGGGASLGSQSTAVLTLNLAPGNPGTGVAGSFEFGSATYTADPSAGLALITINREGGSNGSAAITLTPSEVPNGAWAGRDFDPTTYTITFLPGLTSIQFGIAVDPSALAGDKNFAITLSNPTGGAKLGTQANATVTIPGPTGQLNGQVITAYQEGSTVFFDPTNTGVFQPGDPTTTTDAHGNYHLVLPAGMDPTQGQFVVTGGLNTATGLPSTSTYTAPAGYSIVSPFTTIINDLIQQHGWTRAGAMQQVLKAFHLNPNLDLSTFNPIASGTAGSTGSNNSTGIDQDDDPTALPVFAADVELNALVTEAASLAAGANGSTDPGQYASKVWSFIATLISNNPFDLSQLSDPTQVQTLLTALFPQFFPGLSAAQQSAIDDLVANTYQLFNQTPTPDPNLAGDIGQLHPCGE